MADTTTFSAAMKTKFIGPIRDNLSSNKVLLFGLRTRDDKDTPDPQGSKEFKGIIAEAEGIDFVGNDFRMPLRVARNQGVGVRGQGATLPAPGYQGYAYISDNLRFWYGLFNISGQLLKASESNEGAFTRALTAEMKGVTGDLKRAVNIAAYGTRDTNGTTPLTTIASGTASATQTIGSTIWFQGGEVVDIYDSTGTTKRNSSPLTVTAINRTSKTLTFGASVTTTTGDIVLRASSDSTTAAPNNDIGQGMNGLGNIVSNSGALHGLNPTTSNYWASTVVDAAGATVGDSTLRTVMDGIGFESGADEELLGIWTRGIRNRYVNTLTSLKRFNDASSVTLRGGFKAVLFDEMPFVVDDHNPVGTIHFLNTDAMFWAQMSDWEWMEEDGKTLKWEPRKDSYISILFKYCNLGTFARNRHGKIINAADDAK